MVSLSIAYERQEVCFSENRFLRKLPGDFRNGFSGFIPLFNGVRVYFWEIRAGLCPVLLAFAGVTGGFSSEAVFEHIFPEDGIALLKERLLSDPGDSIALLKERLLSSPGDGIALLKERVLSKLESCFRPLHFLVISSTMEEPSGYTDTAPVWSGEMARMKSCFSGRKASFVRKKMTSKGFAVGVEHDDLVKGAAELRTGLDQQIAFVIHTMSSVANTPGLADMVEQAAN